jgi:REP element-mobilizing transposase RayT
MPRQPRIDLANIPQHVVQRGNDRQPCFFSAEDYLRYWHELREISIEKVHSDPCFLCSRRKCACKPKWNADVRMASA